MGLDMIITVASGKGGTGKTTLSTGLAAVLGSEAQLLDCDVEEPNCHILIKPTLESTESIGLPVPAVDSTKCTACGVCGDVCQFSAITVIGEQVLTFPELCHGCGGCMLMCPENAIHEEQRELGVLETGHAGPVKFAHGILRVGEAMSPPLIKEVRRRADLDRVVIQDAPPGASCPVITTVKGSDYVILVTEPTPFGLHDLRIAVEALKPLQTPMGVVINRSDMGDDKVLDYCRTENIPVLLEIPHMREIAEGYARGDLIVEAAPALERDLRNVIDVIAETVESAQSRRVEVGS